MSILRRLILALALAAGIAPAIAQAPPPIPALPDTQRLTTYSISASVCACSVGFALYGDSTDYQNWVKVYLNGIQVTSSDPTFGWFIASPTGPLSTIPRPVTDGVFNFNAIQTGTVQIVGARRPRRTSQFAENRGVAARDLNQVITDLTSQNRENWDLFQRTLGLTNGLPFGTMAQQNANAVAITGGTITGLPSPINPSDAVNKGYVDTFAQGISIRASVIYATNVALPQSPTYANGAAGVGATLTAGSNAAIVVDGSNPSSGQRILVNNQASSFQNGVYTVTTVGSGGAAWVLTRATDFNQPSQMTAGSYFVVTAGIANINASYVLASTVTTVGTTAVTFNLFSSPAGLNSIITPQGRLTLTSGVPVTTTDVGNSGTHFYTPYLGNLVPIYNGVNFTPTPFTELSQATTDATKSPAAVAASMVYDIFVWNDAGTIRATRGPAWTSDTVIGTGAGTSETIIVNGISLNANAITNGPAAQRGTLVASVRSNASSGLIDSVLVRWVWNAYNPEQRTLSLAPAGSATPYASAAWRQWGGSTAMQVDWLQGRAGRPVSLSATGAATNTSANGFCPISIGIDSITVPSGKFTPNALGVIGNEQNSTATYYGFPGLGRHIGTFLEYAFTGTCTQIGSNTLTSSGIDGYVWQ